MQGAGPPRSVRRMRTPLSLAVLMVCALLLAAIPASATMRCDDSVLERGYTFIEVIERCGQPDLVFQRLQLYVPGVYAPVEEWTYEQGSNKFRRLLTFENGRLRRIELRPKPEVPIEALQRR